MTCSWIRTFCGLKINPLDPYPEQICTTDIAHALSNVCRFGGHGREFYSVAQHSVLVSAWVSPENALWGLLHDAAEAYLGDITTPVKYSPIMDQYRLCEENMMRCIAERFGLQWPQPEEVTFVDKQLLVTEARDLGLLTEDPVWQMQVDLYGCIPTKIKPVDPKSAEVAFYDWYTMLIAKNSRTLMPTMRESVKAAADVIRCAESVSELGAGHVAGYAKKKVG